MAGHDLLHDLWLALGGDADDCPALDVRRRGPVLASAFGVEALLVGAVGSALLAAADLALARGGRAPSIALDVDRLAVAAASERHLRLDGEPVGPAFDPLSAFFATSDGWVRTHGNYAWHRDALLRALGLTGPDPAAVAAALRARSACDVEDAVVAAGGCAAAVRSAGEWGASAQGRAVGAVVEQRPGPDSSRRLPRQAGLPAAGVRVVDLTRVIAGPVGTRMLAALGADVTRIDDPARPELPLLALDGGLGKRRVDLDLRSGPSRDALERSLAAADAVVLGHRPGALDRFGLAPDTLADRHPHLAVVSLSAWGRRGPWGGRRGFDSLVQAATGIADTLAVAGRPGALPVQALDHATGYLVAAAVLRALAGRERSGTAGRAELTLAATARVLLDAGTSAPGTDRAVDPGPHLTRSGGLTAALPPGEIDGVPLSWPLP